MSEVKNIRHLAVSYGRPLRFGLLVTGLVVFGFGGWSAFASLRTAVVASGTLAAEGETRSVQHADGGIVSAIPVRDGDHVNRGDIVMQLDPTQIRSQLAIVENQLYEALARKARLEAERDGDAEIRRPKLLAEMLASDRADIVPDGMDETGRQAADRVFLGQQRLMKAQLSKVEAEVGQLETAIGQSREQITGIEGEKASEERQRDLIVKELDSIRELFKQQLVTLSRVLALERQQASLEGDIAGNVSDIAALKQSIGEQQLQILQTRLEWQEQVLSDLRDAESDVQDLTARRIAALDQLSRVDIRAPVSGTVTNLAVHTIGGVIEAAEVVMGIVPDDEPLIVDAKVDTSAVDQLWPGLPARVRLSAFDRRTTPEIDGSVITVSADRLIDERTNGAYYAVKVRLDQDEIAALGETLMPGMPAEVFLVTGSRTPMSYLTKPLTDQFARAMRDD
ncbi:HlyD family type I secretion periplasmic adaptor subunit [Martelella sp. HB161492]|uniref:HlyD family type I secretion periplasmic adaptor subunit n=1 Tax=Martelella sp. HB161492 TaxID=2720726 RepID=UPI0015901016|nr:HlyD family type I secretion periplasmic adaptor subunit [Martelella sp. HB161492]